MYIQGWVINRGINRFFSMFRPSSLIEAFGSLEKGWLVCAGMLEAHLLNVSAIFLHDGLRRQRKERRSGRSRPATFGSTPWWLTNARCPDRCGASPGPSPAKNTPERKVLRVQVCRVWQLICWGPEFRHVFSQELLGGPDSICRCQILLEDVVEDVDTSSGPRRPHATTKSLDKHWRLLTCWHQRKLSDPSWSHCHHPQDHLLQRSLGKWRDADAGVHISHREVSKVACCCSSWQPHPFSSEISGLDEADWPSAVEEFVTPLLPHFLSVWGSEAAAGQSHGSPYPVLLHHVPHCPWVHTMVSSLLPHALLRIFSHGSMVVAARPITSICPLAMASDPSCHIGAF